MNPRVFKWAVLGASLAVCFGVPAAHAKIHGIKGTTFNLTAKTGSIYTPEGGVYLMWGYAEDPNEMQYPGPTLIVNQGDTITVNLTNQITIAGSSPDPNVSIVFPGQTGVTATGGSPGLLTREAAPGGGTVSYSFTASQPGTYLYHSGTSPELQIEMGLVGAIIVRPTGFNHMMPTAYGHMDSRYDHEVLFLETEMDPDFHEMIEQGRIDEVDMTTWFPVVWFFNGRCAPDTAHEAKLPWLPHQPYNCMPMMHPGDRLLMRVIAAGRDPHPFHTHGNNFDIIARDGRLLQSVSGAGADLSVSNFTITVPPGGTADAIFTWTGRELGWDMYGHEPNDPLEPKEIEAQTTLTSALAPDGTFTVAGAGGFPVTHVFRAILWDASFASPDLDDNREVVQVHNQGNGTFKAVGRAQEGTTSGSWAAGAKLAMTDHGKPFPVTLPADQEVTRGAMWSGSPFLGLMGSLPPGEGGLNPNNGYSYMWHSHAEKEMVNYDIFPGGMMTMLMIVPPSVMIMDH